MGLAFWSFRTDQRWTLAEKDCGQLTAHVSSSYQKRRRWQGIPTSFQGHVFWVHTESEVIFNSLSDQLTALKKEIRSEMHEILIDNEPIKKKKLTGKIKFQMFFIQRFSKEIKQKKLTIWSNVQFKNVFWRLTTSPRKENYRVILNRTNKLPLASLWH